MEGLVIANMINESHTRLMETILEGGGFFALESVLKEDLDKVGRTMLEQVVSEIDEIIVQSAERKKHWTVKRSRERTIKTVFGNVLLKRNYFQHKRTGKYAHLADVCLSLEKSQRFSEWIKYGLVGRVCDVSYAKSAEVVGLTAQTTSNVLKELKAAELKKYLIPNQKRRAETIFVCADEDHIAVREKGIQQQYLIYVYDGIEEMNDRRKLQNIHYFTQEQKGSSEDLWLEVTQYIYDVYDLDCLKKVYIMGDGARWIKQGVEWLPKAVFVLDKWHMVKYISSACAVLDDRDGEEFRRTIWKAIRLGDEILFRDTVKRMRRLVQDEGQLSKIDRMRLYLLHNWEGVQNQKEVHGCSAEGHVSHILSARLSGRPLVWSTDGANRISLLRTYRANGGNIHSLHLQKDKPKSLLDISKIRRQTNQYLLKRNTIKQVTMPILQSRRSEDVKKMINMLFRDSFL